MNIISKKIKVSKPRILIEARKFSSIGKLDGSIRYINSLLNAINHENYDKFDIFLLFNTKIVSLENAIKDRPSHAAESLSVFSRIAIEIISYFQKFSIINRIVFSFRKIVFSIKSLLFHNRYNTNQFDLVHVLLPSRYHYLKIFSQGSIIVMSIHDLTCKIVPHFHLDANNKITWSGIVYASQSCEGIISVSENTKKDFLNYFPNYEGKLTTTHLGFDNKIFYQEFNPSRIGEVKIKYGITSKHYILSLFTLEPRKNLENVILAFELLRQNIDCNHIELIIAGKIGWKIEEDLKSIKRTAGIRLIGYVDESDMAPLYSGATVFCYPSYYEGFGLPLVEAMACGTPVVYGNNSSMPEVVADAGLGCDPSDPKDIMVQLNKICSNAELRSNLSQKSIKRARQFSWEKCAKETLKFYDKLINQKVNHIF